MIGDINAGFAAWHASTLNRSWSQERNRCGYGLSDQPAHVHQTGGWVYLTGSGILQESTIATIGGDVLAHEMHLFNGPPMTHRAGYS